MLEMLANAAVYSRDVHVHAVHLYVVTAAGFRYDLLCVEGIARALLIFQQKSVY